VRAWIGYECKLRDVRLASSEETRSSITIKDIEGSDRKGLAGETRPNNKTGTNSQRIGYFSSPSSSCPSSSWPAYLEKPLAYDFGRLVWLPL
jgi:hypothetical protein